MNETPIVDEIGEEILSACAVIPAGLALDTGINAAGSVGGVAGIVGAAKRRKDRVTPGGHHGDINAAVGPTQLAFFEMKRGLVRKSVGKLLEKTPRKDVAACSFEPSMMGASSLTVELSDGTVFALQVAQVNRSRGEALSDVISSKA